MIIDLSDSHLWDASPVAAVDTITTMYRRNGKAVEITGLNKSSSERHGQLTGELPSP